MQRLVNVNSMTRTPEGRIDAVHGDLLALHALMMRDDIQALPTLEKRVAHFALLENAKRIERKIADFSEGKISNQEQKHLEDSKLTQDEQVELNDMKAMLAGINRYLQNSLSLIPPVLTPIDEKKDVPTIMVAGAGPIGYFSAIDLLYKEEKHQAHVVLIADKYAEFPNKGGVVEPKSFQHYYEALGLSKQFQNQLIECISLRRQQIPSLKHIDMFGRAVYQALGGRIINGIFEWDKIKSVSDSSYPTAEVTPLDAEDKKTEIQRVCCVIAAMGDKSKYPGVERKELAIKEKQKIMRTQSIQLNVSMSPELAEKLTTLNKKNMSGHKFYASRMNTDKNTNTQKVQIHSMMTVQESKVLDELVAQQLPQYLASDLNEKQQADIKLVLKTFFYIEFLSAQSGINIKNRTPLDVMLRDQIKLGKRLCRAFEIPQPSAPPQSVEKIPGTNAVATWVGGAALPPIINGKFISYGVDHAAAVINHLLETNFTAGKLDKTLAGEAYQTWLEEVNKFIEKEQKNGKDMSKAMKSYFAKYYKVTDVKKANAVASSMSPFWSDKGNQSAPSVNLRDTNSAVRVSSTLIVDSKYQNLKGK